MRKTRADRLLTPMMVQNERIKVGLLFLAFFVIFFIGVFLYARGGKSPW